MPRVAHSDVRLKILEAAQQRLWHYGFKKTTIDEIAADAGVGKGTVYLYFESKEDIALAIMVQFKQANLEQLEEIARDPSRPPLAKLKDILTLPAATAYKRCAESPAAQEMIVAVRPHIQACIQPYLDEELVLIAGVLAEGIECGDFAVDDTKQVAYTLKAMCAGFRPPYPAVEGVEAISEEIGRIVQLAFQGIRNPLRMVQSPDLGVDGHEPIK